MYLADHLPALQPPPVKGPAYVRGTGVFRQAKCECADCEQQFRTSSEQDIDRFAYEKEISKSEASRITQERVQNIAADRDYLRKRLLHGNAILSRWKKKSRDKREACLLQVDPELYPHQWFLPRYAYQFPHWTEARKHRKSWLLPYLNLASLKMEPFRLLGLLHNRVVYSPEQWVPYDNKQIKLGWEYGALDSPYCSGSIIMHGPQFGNIIEWDKEAAHRWDSIGYPRAALILEAQETIMKLLRGVVDLLLEGIDVSMPGAAEKWNQVTAAGFKQTSSLEFWSPFINQPFSAPPLFNIVNLVSIAQAKKEAAEDHLWLLQTQPSYMRRAIRDLGSATVYEGVKRQTAFGMIAMDLVHALAVYGDWQNILEECDNVQHQYNRFRDSIHPGDRLPRKYDQALGALELMLVNQMHHKAKHLAAFIPQRPGFRHLWQTGSPLSGQLSIRRNAGFTVPEGFHKDPLDWCLMQLLGDPDGLRRFDQAMLFEFLNEHLANSSSTERARLDQALYDKLSDLAALYELLTAVRLHRPLSTNRDIDDVKRTEQRKGWRYLDAGTGDAMTSTDRLPLGKLLQQFDDTSVPNGKQDCTWLEQSERSRSALSAFWAKVRQDREEWLRGSQVPLKDIQIDVETLSADSRPEHLAAVEAERASILARVEKSSTDPTNKSSQTQWGIEEPNNVPIPVRSKVKPKSRPDNVPETVQAEPNEMASTNSQDPSISSASHSKVSPSTIHVKQRSFAILRSMFPSRPEEGMKMIEWDSFVLAMAEVGFIAKHSGGSAVSFEKDQHLDGHGGKIIFHKPHPVAKIDPVMLHSMGRRMGKWFGWDKEVFCLET